MFDRLLQALRLGGVFGKSVEEPAPIEESPYDIGDIKAEFVPEIREYEAPLLRVDTSEYSGAVRISGQTDAFTIQDERDGHIEEIPADEGTIHAPINRAVRIFELNQYDSFTDLREAIQTWPGSENVSAIGGAGPRMSDKAKHIIMLVPAEYSNETPLKRMQLDEHSGEDGWSHLEQKFNELKGKGPAPLLEG